jgi:type VII secretion protein EccB
VPPASTSPSPTDPGTRPAPATRDQVDAYRFGLRRMEAALVRGDPVLLHEQIRTQRRAVAAGVVLSVLGVVGALLTAHFAPRPTWQEQNLVVGAPSGALYAVAHDPDRLVPVANAVAGRLVLAALRSAAPVSKAPVLVDDAVLADAPRTAAAAVPGAVAADPGQRLAGPWAICDEVAAAPSGARLAGTTVLAGSAPEPSTDPDVGVLLAAPGGDTWLVAAGRRHRVDPRDAAVRTALGLAARAPRPASPGLVSALPEGVGLVTPQVPAAGAAGPPDVPGRVGDVLVSRPAGGAPRYHVVVAGGLQEVPPLVADVLAAASGDPVVEIGPEVVAAAAAVHPLDLAGWPATAPHLREPAEASGTCWSWTGASPEGEIRIGRMPGAAPPVVLAGADGEGAALDAVAVGAGGTVRATAPGVAPGAGTLWVVSATGVAYGVADADSAAALGVTTVEPAPEAVLRLLPTGPALDLAAANRAVDVATAG